jgi:hypothetical protein
LPPQTLAVGQKGERGSADIQRNRRGGKKGSRELREREDTGEKKRMDIKGSEGT